MMGGAQRTVLLLSSFQFFFQACEEPIREGSGRPLGCETNPHLAEPSPFCNPSRWHQINRWPSLSGVRRESIRRGKIPLPESLRPTSFTASWLCVIARTYVSMCWISERELRVRDSHCSLPPRTPRGRHYRARMPSFQ